MVLHSAKKETHTPPGEWVSGKNKAGNLRNHSPEHADVQAQQQHSLRAMTGFWLAMFIEARIVLD
jgi:hypothetical protein